MLIDLAGGSTLILLGSRGSEDWLARETFAGNVYDLPGLDPEAASQLADLILTPYNATKYRQDDNLRKLLKLLDGFPLALEVVLANLAHQTPAAILTALEAGDVSLDKGDTQHKTESILRCIDYSHSNLSPQAQDLLVCLAPFTSVFDLDLLAAYIEYLKQQPILAALPFDRWPEVLKEAQSWGLLTPDADIPSYLHLQPVLPYFLRTRLSSSEQAEKRAAIETAFRQLYKRYSRQLAEMLESKNPQQRQAGQVFVGLEYENIITALRLALAAYDSIFNLHLALYSYLQATQEKDRVLEVSRMVLDGLERYPTSMWGGQEGVDLFSVLNNIANQQLDLKQYEAAEESYHKVLDFASQTSSLDEQTRGRFKASAYHQLGSVAQEQRQWPQAEQYCQQALQISIDVNDRYEQARTYYNLGAVAQEQQQWPQAEQYYQQALQIYIHFNDRYEQARTYGLLGFMAQERGQWAQAGDFLLKALEIFVAYEEHYYIGVVLSHLADLWRMSGDSHFPAVIARVLDASQDKVEALLRKMQGEEEDELGTTDKE